MTGADIEGLAALTLARPSMHEGLHPPGGENGENGQLEDIEKVTAALRRAFQEAGGAVVAAHGTAPLGYALSFTRAHGHDVELVVAPSEGSGAAHRRRHCRQLVGALLTAQRDPATQENQAAVARFALCPSDLDLRAALGAMGALEAAVLTDYAGLGVRRIVLVLPAARWPRSAIASTAEQLVANVSSPRSDRAEGRGLRRSA